MHFVCIIPKSINKNSDYVTLTAFPLQQWLYKTASMLRYTYIAYPFTLFMSIVIGKRSKKEGNFLKQF
jgi:hypothetical protein